MKLAARLLILAIVIAVCGCDTREVTVKHPDGDTINLKLTRGIGIDYNVDMIVTKPTGRSVRFHGCTYYSSLCEYMGGFRSRNYTHETTQIGDNIITHDGGLSDYAKECYLYALLRLQSVCLECAAKRAADAKAVRELFDDAPVQAASPTVPATSSVESSWFVTSSGK